MQTIEERYQHDYREHEHTRIENDRNLLPKLKDISQGKDIDALERFAKGYLGMFLDLDNTIPPQQRIQILASPDLAGGIHEGFKTILLDGQFPEPELIADSMLDDKPYPIGYVLLAALDLFSDESRFQTPQLPDSTIIAAICFHYAYKTEMQDQWLSAAIEHRQTQTAEALRAFWQQLAQRNTDHLPGLQHLIRDRQNDKISAQVLLPILETWKTCRKSTLRDVLHAAIRTTDHTQLLRISETALEEWNAAEPSRYILWLATAFLLAPAKYDMVLSDYTGRSKEKILPLLDFVTPILLSDEHRLNMSADALAQLLRIIAPKFTPQKDRYGELSDITRKVMYLFYCLAASNDPETESAIKRLSLVRVMKLYKSILNYVRDVYRQQQSPTFEVFLKQLVDGEMVKSRIKWSDIAH